MITTKQNSEALEALEIITDARSNISLGEFCKYKQTIRAALTAQSEKVDLNTITINSVIKNRVDLLNKDYLEGFEACIDHLLKHHKGKVIK